MEVIHHTRNDTGVPGYVATLAELLARADTVSLHVPLTSGHPPPHRRSRAGRP